MEIFALLWNICNWNQDWNTFNNKQIKVIYSIFKYNIVNKILIDMIRASDFIRLEREDNTKK